MAFDWTDEHVETCKKMWVSGVSASVIAKKIDPRGGLSRNAVVGKMHRAGITAGTRQEASAPAAQRQSPERRAAAAGTTAQRAPHPAWEKTNPARPARQPAPDLPPRAELTGPIRHPEKATSARPVRHDAVLGQAQCKWPIGDPLEPGFHFCAKRGIEGEPYCPEHEARAYTARSADKRSGKDLQRLAGKVR